jgi:FkbM family methyltransferase
VDSGDIGRNAERKNKLSSYLITNDYDLIDMVFDHAGCIIYGAGRVGKLILQSLQHLSYGCESGFRAEILFAVSGESRLKPPINGYPVKTIAEALADHPDYAVVVAAISPEQQLEMLYAYQNAGGRHEPAVVSVKYLAYIRTLERIQEFEKNYGTRTDMLEKKVSVPDDIWLIDNVRFYVPNYPRDYVQREIVEKQKFYEEDILKQLNQYVGSHSVVFDIGANIGNHSLYWAKKARAQRIYAFEPVQSTYKILEKNIALNRLENVVMPFNVGISDLDGNASTLSYMVESIGSTQLQQSEDGDMCVQRLDSLPLTDQLKRVDFVKIDVEGFEHKVLRGGSKFFPKFKPTIFIESFPDKFDETDRILKSYGYEKRRQFDEINHLYQHPGSI